MFLRSLVCASIVLMIALSAFAAGGSVDVDSSQVEAAFIMNIVRFTQWPASAFNNAADPTRILVIGDETLYQNLQAITRGKSINGRTVDVQASKWNDAWGTPHLIVIKETDPRKMRRCLDTIREVPTLTLGTTKEFFVSGGMIRFFTEDDLLRFEINTGSTKHVGIQMSAKALTLAKRVIGNQ